MTELDRIADQLKRAFEGPAWCGQSVTESLKDVSSAQAFAHPIAGAHSIAELVSHVIVWEKAIRQTILGEGNITVTDEENFSLFPDTSDKTWGALIKVLVNGHLELRHAVENFDMRRLDEIPDGAKSSVYVLLHGVIQHDLYHAAQIMMLKKL